MEGFRKAYNLPNSWGFWRERIVAFYLVFLALVPLGFATLLVAFGNEIEIWGQAQTMHLFKPLIILVWGRRARGHRHADQHRFYEPGCTTMAFPRRNHGAGVLPGAVLATVLWFPATMFFGWYVTHYARTRWSMGH